MPGFSLFRFPQRFLLVTTFALAALAGFGYDALIAWVEKYFQRLQYLVRSTVVRRWLLPSLVVAVIVVDLFVVATRYVGTIDLAQYTTEPPSATLLKQDGDDFRIISHGWMETWRQTKRLSGGWLNDLTLFMDQRSLLPPSYNALVGVASVDDRSMFEGGWGGVDRLNQLLTFFGNGIFYDWSGVSRELTPAQLQVFGLLNVKYILSYTSLTASDGLELTQTIKSPSYAPLHVYRNAYFQPRVAAYFNVVSLKDRSAVLESLATKITYDTLITDEPLRDQSGSPDATATITVIKQGDTRFLAQTNFSEKGYVSISQVFFPGWRATVDGRPVEPIPAFLATTAIPVPAGSHEVEFWYAPKSFAVGAIISITTLIFAGLYLGFFQYTPTSHLKKNPI